MNRLNNLDLRPLALIVENDVELANRYAAILQSAGYQSFVMHDVQTTQAWLQKHVPAIILLDLHLPYISGNKLLQQLKQDLRFAHTRIFIISNDNDPFSGSLDQDVDLIFNRPISDEQLQTLSARYRTARTR